MARAGQFNSFKDFFENSDMEFRREIETVVRKDENIANNRLFVWHFEEIDLEEFLEIFRSYKDDTLVSAAQIKLSDKLLRKMSNMLREGYNPVECMLYASKTINTKLDNSLELQKILAERIKDVYIRREDETAAVLNNCIDMWTWNPQMKVVITAIGLIGDNEELLDKILFRYAEDSNFRTKVFYAFMQNKSVSNLERLMKMVTKLQDTDEDIILGRIFSKEIGNFGLEGMRIVEKYYNEPGISRSGAKIIRKLMVKDSSNSFAETNEELQRGALANKSAKDDVAFREFLEDCYEKLDERTFYLCRFSRAEIGSFLKEMLETGNLEQWNRDTAIVSLGVVGQKGYSPAASVIRQCEYKDRDDYAAIVACVLMNDIKYVEKLVDILCENKDYELTKLYQILKGSNLVNYPVQVKTVQTVLENKFEELFTQRDYGKLDTLSSNCQMFWGKKLYALLSMNILKQMQDVLTLYAGNKVDVPEDIVISLIEIVVVSWNGNADDVEKVIFNLYQNASSNKIRDLSYKKLKGRKIEAPK